MGNKTLCVNNGYQLPNIPVIIRKYSSDKHSQIEINIPILGSSSATVLVGVCAGKGGEYLHEVITSENWKSVRSRVTTPGQGHRAMHTLVGQDRLTVNLDNDRDLFQMKEQVVNI